MNPDIQPHELADMRCAADKAPHEIQRKFHALLDAYEDSAGAAAKLDELQEKTAEAAKALREVHPEDRDERWKSPGEPLSEDAWHERLADCQTPEERTATVDEELKRARVAEAKLLTRVEALEEAVESALGELE